MGCSHDGEEEEMLLHVAMRTILAPKCRGEMHWMWVLGSTSTCRRLDPLITCLDLSAISSKFWKEIRDPRGGIGRGQEWRLESKLPTKAQCKAVRSHEIRECEHWDR